MAHGGTRPATMFTEDKIFVARFFRVVVIFLWEVKVKKYKVGLKIELSDLRI